MEKVTTKKRGERGKGVIKNPGNLNVLRERLFEKIEGYTDSELERMTSVSDSSINSIKNGDRPNPKIDNLISIAKALGTSIDYLVGLSDFDSADVEIKDIAKKTHLSVNAIEILSHMGSVISDQEFFLSLNELIESTYFYEFLFYFKTFLYFNDSVITTIETGTINGEIKISFGRSDYEKKLKDLMFFALDRIRKGSALSLDSLQKQLDEAVKKRDDASLGNETLYSLNESIAELQSHIQFIEREKENRKLSKQRRREENEILRREKENDDKE